jgi:hypothetical protein
VSSHIGRSQTHVSKSVTFEPDLGSLVCLRGAATGYMEVLVGFERLEMAEGAIEIVVVVVDGRQTIGHVGRARTVVVADRHGSTHEYCSIVGHTAVRLTLCCMMTFGSMSY